jgi:hypothetical protein
MMNLYHVKLVHACYTTAVYMRADSHERAFQKALDSLSLTYEQVRSAVITPIGGRHAL